MTAPRDVEVEFEEVAADRGGQTASLVTNARPQFYYLGHDWDCRVEIIALGERDPRIGVRAFLGFGSPEEHVGRLRVGSPFLLRFGHRTVAFGVVTRLVDLERSAREAATKRQAEREHRGAAT